MSYPVQIISNSVKKTDKWKQQNVKAILERMNPYSVQAKRDKLCYDMWNAEHEEDFDYLRKYGDYVLPAKVRWIPIVRPKLQRYLSQETRRNLQVKVFAVDKYSVMKRMEKKKKKRMLAIREDVEQRAIQVNTMHKQLQQAASELQVLVNDNSPEGKQKAAELQKQLPQIQSALESAINITSTEQVINTQKLEEIESYYKMDYRDTLELEFERGLMKAIDRAKINEMKVSALKDKLISGKEFWFVDWVPGEPNPTIKKYNTSRVFYPRDVDVMDCQDLPWFVLEDRYSINQILDEFGSKLSDSQRSKLIKKAEAYGYEYNNNYIATPGDGALDVQGSFYNKGGGHTNFVVRRIFWKVHREVLIKVSPNPYDDTKPFRHIIKNPKEVRPQRGEKLERRYIQDLWSAISIGTSGDLIFDEKKHPVQYRDPAELWKVKNPLIGKTHNGISDKEYSLVWATKDIQELYNVITYHKELTLAISGARGFIMDMSQKPDKMSRKEWMYEYKQGIAWIQTLTKTGKQRTQFNQFQTYDNTLSESILNFDVMLQNLEQNVYNIIGASRESMGQTQASDQVGTYKMATNASSLIAEIIFYEHDKILEDALEHYVNLAKYAWRNGDRGSYITDAKEYEIIDIAGNIPQSTFFNAKLANRSIDVTMIEDLRQQAQFAHSKGELSFEHLVKTYNVQSISEMENILKDYTQTLRSMESQQAMSVEEMKSKLQQENTRLSKEYDMAIAQMKMEIEQMKINVQKAGLELENKRIFVDDQNQKTKIQSDHETKMADIQTERDVESAYLQEQKRASLVSEQLEKIRLQIEALSQSANILIANKDADSKRIDTEIKKVESGKKTGKEKIKD